jgi:hypothetical protein
MILSGYLEKVKGIILENPSEGIKFGKSRFWLLTGFAVRDIFN